MRINQTIRIIFAICFTTLFQTLSFTQTLNRQMKVDTLYQSSRVVLETDKAVIMVHSQIPNLRFESNRRIDKVTQVSSGDWEVWIPYGTHILKIDADGFQRLELPATNFAQKRSYEMAIKAVGFAPDRIADENLFEIVFKLSEDNVYSSYGNFSPTLSKSKTISYKLPQGEFTFRFSKDGFADETKTMNVSQNQQLDITLKAGTTTQIFSLPGIVQITSEPSGAEILVNGQKVGATPYQGELVAGNHQLELRKALYHSDVSTFTIEEGKTKSLSLKLKPRFGILNVTEQPSGTSVYLNDKFIGEAPITNYTIESQTYSLLLTQKFYHDSTFSLEVRDGETYTITTQMRPAFGTLSVTSSPENNAEVFLDGKKAGVTPFTNNKLTSGKYLLKVSKELYNDTEEQILIEDGKTTTKTILLNKNYGELNVTANESKIFLNNKEVGEGTYTARLNAGRYQLRAERGEKYTSDEKEVYVSVGENKNITLTPTPKLGSVSVFVEPMEASDAEIFVNEEYKGTAPKVLPLLIGDYRITAKKNNFLDKTETISLLENDKKQVRFELLTYEGTRQQSIDRWARGKWISIAGATLATGVGTYFFLSAEKKNDYYNAATNGTDVKNFRDIRDKHQLYFQISVGGAGAFLAGTIYSWVMEKSY
ncbi:MAG: PEGA domain-containing protein [Ignavibacteria bacterium]|nr:PEGA domain-containing protein [Ignavibacteria bacterium]